MGSIYYGGKIRMQAVDVEENKSDDFYDHSMGENGRSL